MHKQVEKTPDSKIQSAANAVAQKKNNGTDSKVIVDNRPESVLQRKIEDATSNSEKNVAQLHPKKASGTGMSRKDPGHGNVKSKQHADTRAKKDGKRAAKQAAERERLQEKRAAEEAAKAAK